MTACYLCGTSLNKGQGVRRTVRTGTSVAGLASFAPTLLTIVISALFGIKQPSIRSYFSLRTLCPSCVKRVDARRVVINGILLGAGGVALTFIALAFLR